jgi:hypothetical protein
MNERIKTLYTEACKDLDITQDILQKFAELIVRECMTTVLKESKWYWDKDEFESANAIQNAARRVKEHFGVE